MAFLKGHVILVALSWSCTFRWYNGNVTDYLSVQRGWTGTRPEQNLGGSCGNYWPEGAGSLRCLPHPNHRRLVGTTSGTREWWAMWLEQDVREMQSRTSTRRRSVKRNGGAAAIVVSPKESCQIRRLFAHRFVHVRNPGTVQTQRCSSYS